MHESYPHLWKTANPRWYRRGLPVVRQREVVTPACDAQFHLHQRQAPGWFGPIYERLYRRWARLDQNGERYLYPEALDDPVEKRIPIGDRLIARFTVYPHRSEYLQKSDGTRWPALSSVTACDTTLRLLPRPVPYAKYQGLLVTDADEPQRMDVRRLALCLLFARALGKGWMVMFNKAGMTKDRFHVQFFKGSTPLFDAIASGTLKVTDKRIEASGTVSAQVLGWPVETSLLMGTDARRLARSVMALAADLEASGLTFDLAIRYDGSTLCALVLRRALTAMDHLKTADDRVKDLGSLGTLELSGWVVSIADPELFHKLTAAPRVLADVYLQALKEVAAKTHNEPLILDAGDERREGDLR